MTEDDLIAKIRSRFGYLFHFTDTRNLPEIRRKGLLSRRELTRQGVTCTRYGGNQLSRNLDDSLGLDDYVHLSFFSNHPMERFARARAEDPILASRLLQIDPTIIKTQGVRYCATVSNRNGAQLLQLADLSEKFDVEVMFTRLNWSNPDIQQRVQIAEKYEVLVPIAVPLAYIRI